jgi:hypothetical protein
MFTGTAVDRQVSRGRVSGPDAASADLVNSVSYHWTNPASAQTEPKTPYFRKVDDQVCGVGAYTP